MEENKEVKEVVVPEDGQQVVDPLVNVSQKEAPKNPVPMQKLRKGNVVEVLEGEQKGNRLYVVTASSLENKVVVHVPGDGDKEGKDITLTYLQVKKVVSPEYKSRATRLSECLGNIGSIAEQLTELKDQAEEENVSDEDKARIVEEANTAMSGLDISEIESLKEEIESWRDNMSGTPLESTEKYSRLEECADALDDIGSATDSLTTEISSVDELESVISEYEEVAGRDGEVEFPGMFG